MISQRKNEKMKCEQRLYAGTVPQKGRDKWIIMGGVNREQGGRDGP